MNSRIEILAKYMPIEAAPLISRWIDHYEVAFKVNRARSTKLGDYRHPFREEGHRISVNYNLNPYAFLVTTVHEFAHLITWDKHRNKVNPHGTEWKIAFRTLMEPFLEKPLFPPELNIQLRDYLQNPAASSCSDLGLMRMLARYDQPKAGMHTVESLPMGTVFYLPDGRKFKKGDQLRKRFRCEELPSRRIYLFNPLAMVKTA